MKLTQDEVDAMLTPPLKEEVEYGDEFADTILNEAAGDSFVELDFDRIIAHLDKLIVEADQHGQTH